jgi:hypothetical protein
MGRHIMGYTSVVETGNYDFDLHLSYISLLTPLLLDILDRHQLGRRVGLLFFLVDDRLLYGAKFITIDCMP